MKLLLRQYNSYLLKENQLYYIYISWLTTINLQLKSREAGNVFEIKSRGLHLKSDVIVRSPSRPRLHKSRVTQHKYCRLVLCTVLSRPQAIKSTPAPSNLLALLIPHASDWHVSQHTRMDYGSQRTDLRLSLDFRRLKKGQADYRVDPSMQNFDAEQFLHLPD